MSTHKIIFFIFFCITFIIYRLTFVSSKGTVILTLVDMVTNDTVNFMGGRNYATPHFLADKWKTQRR